MAYKYSKGKTYQGDIYNEDDTQRNTYLDWSEDAVGIVAGGELTLAVSGAVVIVSGSGTPLRVDGAISSSRALYGTDLVLKTNDSSGIASLYIEGTNGTEIIGMTGGGLNILSQGGDLHVVAGTDYAISWGTDNTYWKMGLSTNGDLSLPAMSAGNIKGRVHVSGSDSDNLFYTNSDSNDDVFVVCGDGKVGIGTASPSKNLDIEGADNAIIQLNATNYRSYNVGSDGYGFVIHDDTTGGTAGYRFVISDQAAALGYVGIGAGASIAGSNHPDALLHLSSSDDGQIFRADTTDGTTVLFVTGSGRVGIGTASPNAILHITGALGPALLIEDGNIHLSGTNTAHNPEIQFIDNAHIGVAGLKIRYDNSNGNSYFENMYNNTNAGIFFTTREAGTADNVLSLVAGQVGIGTASPSEALTVIGDISGSGDLVVGDDVLIVSGSSVGIGFAPWSGKELHVTDGDSSTAGAPADSQVVVESGGNAGISLLAGGTRARIFFGDSSDIDEGIIEYKFTNSERFNIDVGGNEVMRIYESGASNTITTLNGVKTTAGLFTEGHPYYSNDENITVGDCCVLENGQIVRSSSPMQKNVSGIAWYSVLSDLQNSGSSGDEAWPLTLDDATVSRVASDALGIQCNMAEESGGEWVPTAKFQTLWKLAALGDSRQSNYGTTDLTGFKVCNEGGEVSAGDLLCTSTTPGFLMKQSDDIMRSYTVGKAMEDVTFDGNGQATGIYGYIYCG